MTDTRDPDKLMQVLEQADKDASGLPPVHAWHPEHVADIDMRIARDGTWYYQGTPINRPAMVRLFSTILRREGDRYYLVTPVEKLGIVVEDAPFVAVTLEVLEEQGEPVLAFTTNVGATVVADAEHPLRVDIDSETGEPSPYLYVRDGMEALVHRNVFYALVEQGQRAGIDGTEWLVVHSRGVRFPVGRLDH
ncbi:DUF1285 domain-containing protein [Isoalcanivorax indicus]|uniref:DUF1285 domain-containing protein n=1 Tax=Isoalcanivorax indicus TaxID=2202653 RepID=UPI000DB9D873|nr:DUF1285 domain-containing protein [Isoalcanivorax indicus]